VIRDFPGNYSQYREEVKEQSTQLTDNSRQLTDNRVPSAEQPVNRELSTVNLKKKVSFKEKREFELLAKEIETLTVEKSSIHEKFSQGNLSFDELQSLSERIGAVTQMLDEKEMRWLELSELM